MKPLYIHNEYIISNTQDFSKLIQEQSPPQFDEEYVSYDIESQFTNVPIPEVNEYILYRIQFDEEYVSYDIESQFTNVPIPEVNEYILYRIYVHNKLSKLGSWLIFKRLLLKLTTESTYMFNSKLYKQFDG